PSRTARGPSSRPTPATSSSSSGESARPPSAGSPRPTSTSSGPACATPATSSAVCVSALRDAASLCDAPVTRPDHVDAMLCALAAEACLHADGLPAGTIGLPPVADPGERVLREGFIVAPGHQEHL